MGVYMDDIKMLSTKIGELEKLVKKLVNSKKLHSLRIRKLNKLYNSAIAIRKYYISKKLPIRLQKDKERINMFKKTAYILEQFKKCDISRFSSSNKVTKRYLGFFTHEEIEKLRRLLSAKHNFANESFHDLRYEEYSKRNLILLSKDDTKKLINLLEKSCLQQIQDVI